MKKTTLAATLSTIITLSSSAYALDLMVVKNYDQALNKEVWKKVKPDEVPDSLLSLEKVDTPASSYSHVYPKTFLQDNMFGVCYMDCERADSFQTQNGEITNVKQINWDVIEQTNIYYWLKKYFTYLNESLYFQPQHYLKVMSNRDISQNGQKLQNNAFFNPEDITLSFLPAKNSILFKLLQGKLNRSGFDPSVIAHETSHFVFYHLFRNNVNIEINGVNEGFADFISHGFMGNPKIGAIMLQGTPLRDSSREVDSHGNPKIYKPGLEAHDLGERVAFALWKTRELARDKHEFDRLVLEAVLETGKNHYSTAHDFKERLLERINIAVDAQQIESVNKIWNFVIEGSSIKIASTNFLSKKVPQTPKINLREKQTLPLALAKENGVEPVTENNLSLFATEKISETQVALLIGNAEKKIAPHWVVNDNSRGNILGVYDLNKTLLNTDKDIEAIDEVITKARIAGKVFQQFGEQISNFSDVILGKGGLGISYKIIGKSSSSDAMVFNGSQVPVQKLKVQLKRKLLGGALLGAPDIDSIEVYTVPLNVADVPKINGESAVGFKLQLKNGMTSEVVIDSYPLNQK